MPPFGDGPKASCHECIEPYNQLVRSIAAAKGATLVDVHAAWAGRTGLKGADGMHPTAAGYEVIYLGWYATKTPAAVLAQVRPIVLDRLARFAASA